MTRPGGFREGRVWARDNLAAVRGGLGFLTRLPVGHDERSWAAFRATPTVFPVAGYVSGSLLVLPFFLPFPGPGTAFVFVAWVYLVTGINHADGLADLGDAVVVHGGPDERRAVMNDTDIGVGGVLAVGLVLLGLALAAVELATLPVRALGIVLAAEVGAKLAMALVICLGSSAAPGLGAEFTRRSEGWALASPIVTAVPAAAVAWPSPAPGVALVVAVAAGVSLHWWSGNRLGGITGDVLGAVNELARVAALHAGVIAWTAF